MSSKRICSLRTAASRGDCKLNQTFLDYYRCPESFANFTVTAPAAANVGFFQFGEGVYCYGSNSSGGVAAEPRPDLYDAIADVVIGGTSLRLPFNPAEITENLRRERYVRFSLNGFRPTGEEYPFSHAYRLRRPALPLSRRRRLHRLN